MSANNQFSGTRAEAQALRDELFRRASIGEITGDEADAQAISQGLGSLSQRPGPHEFRPESVTHWALPMAVAWIAYLDLDQVREWSAPYREACLEWRWQRWRLGFDGPISEGWHLERRSKPTLPRLGISATLDGREDPGALAMSVSDAQDALWVALREGFFAASGIDTETNQRVEIPALHWHELISIETKERDEVRRGRLGSGYREVLIPSRALRGFWSPPAERQLALPATVLPTGDGYMPLYCAAQWIATRGDSFKFDPEDRAVWMAAYDQLLSAIASEKVRVVGFRDGQPELVAGYHFAGCAIDYPFGSVEMDLRMGDRLYLRSYPYLDDDHWNGGFDDALVRRGEERWKRLMVERESVRSLWPFGKSAETSTGLPGRPTLAKHLIDDELQRRAEAGQLADTLAEEAKALLAWLRNRHPMHAPPTIGTIQNNIRIHYWRLKPTK